MSRAKPDIIGRAGATVRRTVSSGYGDKRIEIIDAQKINNIRNAANFNKYYRKAKIKKDRMLIIQSFSLSPVV